MALRVYSEPRHNRLIACLKTDTYEALQSSFEPIRLRADQALLDDGQYSRALIFPTIGVISLLLRQDDREVQVATLGSDGMVGVHAFLAGQPSPYIALLMTDGEAYRLRYDVVQQKSRQVRSDVFGILARYTCLFLEIISINTLCASLHTIEQRTATHLLLLEDYVGNGGFDLTHENLARMLGVRRASITDVAGGFQDRAALTYRRGHVAITNRPAVEAAACRCYRHIRNTIETVLNALEARKNATS